MAKYNQNAKAQINSGSGAPKKQFQSQALRAPEEKK